MNTSKAHGEVAEMEESAHREQPTWTHEESHNLFFHFSTLAIFDGTNDQKKKKKTAGKIIIFINTTRWHTAEANGALGCGRVNDDDVYRGYMACVWCVECASHRGRKVFTVMILKSQFFAPHKWIVWMRGTVGCGCLWTMFNMKNIIITSN